MKIVKKHIYFVPGLAASPKIFDRIKLPESKFECHFIEWLLPLSDDESIENYAKRMARLVTHDAPILIGVSFGGIMVQEMSKHLNTQKIILISSVKTMHELPARLKFIQKSKVYKLFPAKAIANIEGFSTYVFGEIAKKRIALYKEYLSVRDERYLKWAIYQVLHWKQKKPLKNTLHIHGTEDGVFPVKYIKNYIPIKKGTHVMILTKAKEISKIITESV
ncbi:alpha/beta hydrolase [Lutibacter sp.]